MAVVEPVDGDQWHAVHFGSFDFEGVDATASGPRPMLAAFRPDIRREGLLWPTIATDRTRIEFREIGGRYPLRPAPTGARRAFMDLHFNGYVGREWDALILGDRNRTYALPAGYILNTVTIACAIGAPLVFPWRGAAEWIREGIRALRRRPWQCQSCGYDLRGLPSGVCPECGTGTLVVGGAQSVSAPGQTTDA
ncbi:MAG: hypothetical protein R3B68_14780 [Phycisphaerales bacterium]